MQWFITYDILQYPEMFFLPYIQVSLCFQRMTNFCKINVSYSNCFGGGWDSKANDNTRNGNFRNIVEDEDIKLTPRTLSDVSSSFHVMIYFRGITSSRLGCSYIIPWPFCVFFFFSCSYCYLLLLLLLLENGDGDGGGLFIFIFKMWLLWCILKPVLISEPFFFLSWKFCMLEILDGA